MYCLPPSLPLVQIGHVSITAASVFPVMPVKFMPVDGWRADATALPEAAL